MMQEVIAQLRAHGCPPPDNTVFVGTGEFVFEWGRALNPRAVICGDMDGVTFGRNYVQGGRAQEPNWAAFASYVKGEA